MQPRNPEEIAEKIVWLIENPEKAKQMGRNGRILAEEKFNIDRRIDRIIQLYKEVLRKH